MTANWLYDQMRAAHGVRSVVLTKKRENSGVFPWDRVHSLDARSRSVRLANRALRRIIGHYPSWEHAARGDGVRLVHAHFGPMGIHGLTLARALGVPLLTSFYGVDIWKHKRGDAGLRARYAGLFERGDGFLVEGPAAGNRVAALGCPENKIHVHRLGVDLTAIPFIPRTAAADRPLRVLVAARFTEKKGIVYGVEAFCRVAAETPRLRLTIFGAAAQSDEERRIESEVRSIVARYGVESNVEILGMITRDELRAAFRDHDVLLHPSVRAGDGDAEGGHPVVITEASASGMPTIATTHCDIPQIVAHGETGWLCEERDPAALADALRHAASNPEELLTRGAAARARVERLYDIRAERWDRIYDRCLPSRP